MHKMVKHTHVMGVKALVYKAEVDVVVMAARSCWYIVSGTHPMLGMVDVIAL